MNIEALLSKKEFQNYKDEIITWIKTDEFKSLSTPYPPLLNLKNINYTKIPAEVAWELNLPLPQYYKFLYLGSHGTGGIGFLAFLNKLGGHCIYVTNTHNSRENYLSLYKQIIEYIKTPNKAKFVYLALRNYVCDEESKKFHSLIRSNKSIYLARDPISNLKSLLSTRIYYDKSVRKLNLNIKPSQIVSKLIGYASKVTKGGGGVAMFSKCRSHKRGNRGFYKFSL